MVVQVFYVASSLLYIKLISKEQEIAPYLINELRSIHLQCQKGLSLGLSAFLLLTIYSIIILKLGRVVLPKHLDFGEESRTYWPAFLLVGVVNPILEEWYWRLFLPKVRGWAHLDHQDHVREGTDHQHLLPAVPFHAVQPLPGLLAVDPPSGHLQQRGPQHDPHQKQVRHRHRHRHPLRHYARRGSHLWVCQKRPHLICILSPKSVLPGIHPIKRSSHSDF